MRSEVFVGSLFVLVISLLSIGASAFAQEGNNSTDTPILEKILQYCRFVHDYGMNDGKEDIQSDLIDTGKIPTNEYFELPKTCHDAKELDQRMDKVVDDLNDLKALSEMEK